MPRIALALRLPSAHHLAAGIDPENLVRSGGCANPAAVAEEKIMHIARGRNFQKGAQPVRPVADDRPQAAREPVNGISVDAKPRAVDPVENDRLAIMQTNKAAGPQTGVVVRADASD